MPHRPTVEKGLFSDSQEGCALNRGKNKDSVPWRTAVDWFCLRTHSSLTRYVIYLLPSRKNGLKEYHTFPIINQFKICSGLSENTSTTDDSKDYIISLTVSAEFETSLTLPKITAFSTLVIYRYKFAIFVW